MNSYTHTDIYKNDATYDLSSRTRKAKKIVAVILDSKRDLDNLACLDLGCSVGIITAYLGKFFRSVWGLDVDDQAIQEAKRINKQKNITFAVSTKEKINFKDNLFDVVIFNQVYEHAKSPEKLLHEIKRVMKSDGLCYFGARNKYSLFDGHYPIPFLSWMPKSLANFLVKFFFKRPYYDVKLYSLPALNKLVKDFKKRDYTLKILMEPSKFKANDVVPKKFYINKMLVILSKFLYFFMPNYIWILTK